MLGEQCFGYLLDSLFSYFQEEGDIEKNRKVIRDAILDMEEYCRRPYPIIISHLSNVYRLVGTTLATEFEFIGVTFDEQSVNTVLEGIKCNPSLNKIKFSDCKFSEKLFTDLMEALQSSQINNLNFSSTKILDEALHNHHSGSKDSRKKRKLQ